MSDNITPPQAVSNFALRLAQQLNEWREKCAMAIETSMLSEKEVQRLRQENQTLRAERDEARRLYCEKMSPGDPPKHAEKWRWDCYGEFDEVEKLRWRLEETIEERDKARREICDWVSDGKQNPKAIAERYGWDCWKEHGK